MAAESACLIMMALLLLAPVVIAVILSFTQYSLGSDHFSWVGFDNYLKVFNHSRYQKMFGATLGYVAIVVPISMILGLGTAMLINSLRVGKDIYKTIYFLPVMASLLAIAIVWEFTLHPTVGIINDTLASGCNSGFWYPFLTGSWYGNPVNESWYGNACADSFPLWLGDRDFALPTLAFIGIWQTFGFNMVLYLAGLMSVPQHLYQAAAIDGVNSV
ncbi:carbohydrate ABC transporter permease [Veronia nyctiphanis]|uniref:carbohydrate ABC transporter permease n=1 Tax=Veronia nyctiphanis TaxID=1278244 RepID=UPI00191C3559|nr:sugar ABC transporter permease [Veronia nyctiphanis]